VRALALLALFAAVARGDETLSIGGSTLALEVETSPDSTAKPADIDRWVRHAAVAVSSFYGHFPVPRVRIVVVRVPGRRIFGTTFDGKLIRLRLGTDAPAAELEQDWTLTHEMFHLGFPDMNRRHLWMQEGLSTYFEPIARARVGDLTPAEHWRELFQGLPNGLPDPDRGGLDVTPTWGATYWGGTLFWFLADLRIREETGNRRSADDAIRAVLAAGGDGSQDWPMERVLEVGDKGTGTTVLASLYQELGKKHFQVDLKALAARLGVADGHFDDTAPLAAIRRSITDPKQNPVSDKVAPVDPSR
jgi:hypothetical protein